MRTKSDFGMPRMAQRIQTTHRSTAQPLRAGGDTAWEGEWATPATSSQTSFMAAISNERTYQLFHVS